MQDRPGTFVHKHEPDIASSSNQGAPHPCQLCCTQSLVYAQARHWGCPIHVALVTYKPAHPATPAVSLALKLDRSLCTKSADQQTQAAPNRQTLQPPAHSNPAAIMTNTNNSTTACKLYNRGRHRCCHSIILRIVTHCNNPLQRQCDGLLPLQHQGCEVTALHSATCAMLSGKSTSYLLMHSLPALLPCPLLIQVQPQC